MSIWITETNYTSVPFVFVSRPYKVKTDTWVLLEYNISSHLCSPGTRKNEVVLLLKLYIQGVPSGSMRIDLTCHSSPLLCPFHSDGPQHGTQAPAYGWGFLSRVELVGTGRLLLSRLTSNTTVPGIPLPSSASSDVLQQAIPCLCPDIRSTASRPAPGGDDGLSPSATGPFRKRRCQAQRE